MWRTFLCFIFLLSGQSIGFQPNVQPQQAIGFQPNVQPQQAIGFQPNVQPQQSIGFQPNVQQQQGPTPVDDDLNVDMGQLDSQL